MKILYVIDKSILGTEKENALNVGIDTTDRIYGAESDRIEYDYTDTPWWDYGDYKYFSKKWLDAFNQQFERVEYDVVMHCVDTDKWIEGDISIDGVALTLPANDIFMCQCEVKSNGWHSEWVFVHEVAHLLDGIILWAGGGVIKWWDSEVVHADQSTWKQRNTFPEWIESQLPRIQDKLDKALEKRDISRQVKKSLSKWNLLRHFYTWLLKFRQGEKVVKSITK